MEYIGVIAGKSGDAIVKEIHRWGKWTAIVCGKENEKGIEWSEESLICDLSNKEKILKYFKEINVKRVIFGTGHILAIELAQYLKLNGISINIIPEVSFMCNDKYELKMRIKEMGLLTPDFYRVDNSDSIHERIDSLVKDLGLPCVLKSIKDIETPQLIWDIDELYKETEVLLTKEPTVMFEKYVKGNDCTAVVVNNGGDAKCIYAMPWSKASEDELKGFVKTIPEPLSEKLIKEISAVVEKLVNQINVLGVCRVDFIVKENKIYILEINSLIFSSILEGSVYTINNFINHVNLSKMIVQAAMSRLFCDNEESPSRVEERMIFIDSNEQFKEYSLIEPNAGIKLARVNNDRIMLHYSENGEATEFDYEYIKSIYTYRGNFNIEIMIKRYLDNKEFDLTEEEVKKVTLFAGFILAQNSDFYLNKLVGKDYNYLEIALAFLNRKEM